MRKLIIIFLIVVNTIYAQEFKYSGVIYNAAEVGMQNIPVKLYGKRTAMYSINQPTYTAYPYNVGTVVPSSDDATHGPFNIGFTFNFFGINYTQFYIGSNGWIGFSPGQTTGYTAAFIPNSGSPLNCILADWEDLLPGASNIYYQTVGTLPNRKLVVSFYQVPHYSCAGNLHTFQFVLSEGSNAIQINYLSKPQCGTNNATAGLIGTAYTTVAPLGGNNAVQWTETSSSYGFTQASPETVFSLKGLFLTNAAGTYSVESGLDINSYQFQLRIDSIPSAVLSSTAANIPVNLALGTATVNAKKYYMADVNNDSRFTVSDSYYIYGMMSGRFFNWKNTVPKYRIFNPTEWNIIKISNLDLRITYPGVQSILLNSPVNNGTSNFYLLRTGFIN